jgi:hypothetical protein
MTKPGTASLILDATRGKGVVMTIFDPRGKRVVFALSINAEELTSAFQQTLQIIGEKEPKE